MSKKRVFKMVPYDEVNNVWLLKEKVWWIFFSFVSAGNKKKLTQWVADVGGELVN
jgi:hypothetical protein